MRKVLCLALAAAVTLAGCADTGRYLLTRAMAGAGAPVLGMQVPPMPGDLPAG